MMSPVLRFAAALLLLTTLIHAQVFFHHDPMEMLQRIQRAARPKAQFSSSSSSASSSSSSSGSGAPIFFGGSGTGFGFPGQSFQSQGYYPGGHQSGFTEHFGDYDNGGHLGVRLGSVPGGGSVEVSSSSHSNGRRPGATGSFVSSSSSTDGDGRIHYRVNSGRF